MRLLHLIQNGSFSVYLFKRLLSQKATSERPRTTTHSRFHSEFCCFYLSLSFSSACACVYACVPLTVSHHILFVFPLNGWLHIDRALLLVYWPHSAGFFFARNRSAFSWLCLRCVYTPYAELYAPNASSLSELNYKRATEKKNQEKSSNASNEILCHCEVNQTKKKQTKNNIDLRNWRDRVILMVINAKKCVQFKLTTWTAKKTNIQVFHSVVGSGDLECVWSVFNRTQTMNAINYDFSAKCFLSICCCFQSTHIDFGGKIVFSICSPNRSVFCHSVTKTCSKSILSRASFHFVGQSWVIECIVAGTLMASTKWNAFPEKRVHPHKSEHTT